MSEDRTPADILRGAARRLADQGHFVMGAWAWDRQGREADPLSPDAWRWSARGAIYVESGIRPLPLKERDRDHQVYRLLDRAARAVPHFRVGAWAQGDVLHDCRCIHDVADNLGHALTLKALEDAALLDERGSAP